MCRDELEARLRILEGESARLKEQVRTLLEALEAARRAGKR